MNEHERSTHAVIGTGPLGMSVARQLLAQGKDVVLVGRSAPELAGARSRRVDIRTSSDYLDGVAVAYQCAMPAYDRRIQEFEPLQAGVLAAAARAGSRVVLADNLYALGDGGGVISDESPIAPLSRKGELRARMAAAALAEHAAGRVRVALTRPSNYVGGGYRQFQGDVPARALAGKPMRFLGSLDAPHSYSYVPDAARAMVAIGTGEAGWGRAWVTPTLAPVTQRELGRLVWEAAGRTDEPRYSVMGKGTARALGVAIPKLGALVEMWYEFDSPYIVDSSAFTEAFGFAATEWSDVTAAVVS